MNILILQITSIHVTRSGFKVQNDVVEEKGYSAFRIPDLDLVSPNKTHGFEIHMHGE